MKFRLERDRRTLMLRCWGAGYRDGEIAYAVLGLCGPRVEIEFPSDWHEHRRAWVRLGFGILTFAFSFPWKHVVPDENQCSGPTYGFYFFADTFVLKYGKETGRSSDRKTSRHIYLPWSWVHIRHDYLNPDGSFHHASGPYEYSAPDETKQSFPYRYKRNSGEIQERIATINGEEREWRWRLLSKFPWPRKIQRTINIEFNDEVGERTGSWKGGTLGCSWEWRHGETMVEALWRMQAERKFT